MDDDMNEKQAQRDRQRVRRKRLQNVPLVNEFGRPLRVRMILRVAPDWKGTRRVKMFGVKTYWPANTKNVQKYRFEVYFWTPPKIWTDRLAPGQLVFGSWKVNKCASPRWQTRTLTHARGLVAGTGHLWDGERPGELQHPEWRVQEPWHIWKGQPTLVLPEGKTWTLAELEEKSAVLVSPMRRDGKFWRWKQP